MHYPRWSSNSSSATSPKSPGIISNMCLGRSRTSKIDEDSTVTFRVQLVELVKTLNQLCFVCLSVFSRLSSSVHSFCLYDFLISVLFQFSWESLFVCVFPQCLAKGFCWLGGLGPGEILLRSIFTYFLLRNWFSLLIKGVPCISSFTSFCHVILSWPFVIFSILINAFLFSFPCSSGLLVFLGSASFLDSDA